MINAPISPTRIKEKEAEVVQKLAEKREGVFTRFPLLFTLLGTFGLVATFYGFEAMIDRIDLLANNPFILLGVGLATLIITGSLYKKLG
jgi:hypothetical protein